VSVKLRIGIVGAARVATYAMIEPARAVGGVEVAAVAARDPARARDYAATHGIPRVAESYDALMRDPEIDLIYIATPPNVHAAQAMAAIDAGKPVLVEKPFAMTAAEARTVFEAARAKGVPVFEAMHSPHHALFARVLQIVKGGEIGRVRHMEAEFGVPIPRGADEFRWRADCGGGALMDLGVYPLTWCRRVAGEPTGVERVEAEMVDGVDARFSARLRFADEATANISSSMLADQPNASLRIDGSDGKITVVNPLAPQMGYLFTVESDGKTRSETVQGPSTYKAQLAAVRDTLTKGAAFPFPADDYVRSMTAIDMVRAAF
jgi:predicted dehydrogenase